jgi:NADP-dependent aldehyde dehydrogenase
MSYTDATPEQIQLAMQAAQLAFLSYKNVSGRKKAAFLRAIADEIEALGGDLINVAMEETNLPEARLAGERARTTGHCRMFAALVEEGSWVDARIDHGDAQRTPLPKPDLRKMLFPIGPVVDFGAANFPLAYSTAGGDTASALAAGCPVVVKAHPAHAHTSAMVAGAVQAAVKSAGMPRGVFQHLYGASFEVGTALVKHPYTKAVGFTGSLAGGKALFDSANQRPEPIPVFAEMSSINPVILLPNALSARAEMIAEQLANSITLSVGQFCTNPGLIVAMEGEGLSVFVRELAVRIERALPGTMLHKGIADNYHLKVGERLSQRGVQVVAGSTEQGNERQGQPLIAGVSGKAFLDNPQLAHEVFGPFSLIVTCADRGEFFSVIAHLSGQLTATIFSNETELHDYSSLVNMVVEKAGRIIFNGVPTGVEVCAAMQHGGPFPSTTDSRFSSVGTDAIKRFVRPVSFQNFPDAVLPDELKESNPSGIWRLVDQQWTK